MAALYSGTTKAETFKNGALHVTAPIHRPRRVLSAADVWRRDTAKHRYTAHHGAVSQLHEHPTC